MNSPRSIIDRLCELQAEVVHGVVGYEHGNDCFCGRGGFWTEDGNWPEPCRGWTNAEEAINFIEGAVRDAINRRKGSGH